MVHRRGLHDGADPDAVHEPTARWPLRAARSARGGGEGSGTHGRVRDRRAVHESGPRGRVRRLPRRARRRVQERVGAPVSRLRSAGGRRPAALLPHRDLRQPRARASRRRPRFDHRHMATRRHRPRGRRVRGAARRHRPRDPLRRRQLRVADRVITAAGGRRGSSSALAGSRTGTTSSGWPVPLPVRRHVSAFVAVAGDRISCCGAATSACRRGTPGCRPTRVARSARLGRHRLPDDGDGMEPQPGRLPDGDRGSSRSRTSPSSSPSAATTIRRVWDPSPTTCSFTNTSPKVCCCHAATP